MTQKLFRLAMLLACLVGVFHTSAQTTFNNADASAIWAFNSDNYMQDVTTSPDGAISQASFDINGQVYKGITNGTKMCPDIKFVQIGSKNGASDLMKWTVKPAKGLTFTPMKISFYVTRMGTDGSVGCVSVQGKVNGQQAIEFSKITPHRNNKTQADDKYGSDPSYTTHYEYTLTAEQQQKLTSGEGFSLVVNNGFDTSKGVGYSDVRIIGKVNGTTVNVNKYTLSAKANPDGSANITVNPQLDQYEEDSQVTLTAEPLFGYKFVNWTDASGKEVSKDLSFKYTVKSNTELTANLTKVNTYELTYSVEGGANIYQIQPSPAPTMVGEKMMYEEGVKVTLSAISNEVITFTNWSDGQSSSEISFNMTANKDITGVFSAKDFVVAWDFYQSGGSGRPADFYATDNDAVTLVLRDADGNSIGWLDKSQQASGGYEGAPAAVNWNTEGLGKYYWQTTVNAAAFTGMSVKGSMLYNYNAYSKYNVEASTDDAEWTRLGTVTLQGAKTWTPYEFTLPAKFNNQEKVSIRWIADKSSAINGTSSNNDGIALGAIYILGTPQLINDGTAPVLVSQVPAEGTDNASIAGKIVLNFDEKVKMKQGVKGNLSGQELEGSVSGKTVMFNYKNLSYGSNYTFTLPAGAVMDLCDNATTAEIKINFTTRNKPAVAKALYDFVVPDDGTLNQAIAASEARSDASKRFRIFIKNGNYKLESSKTATKNGSDGKAYPDPTTYINVGNVSFIGESMDGVVITNDIVNVYVDGQYGKAHVLEGIGNGDVINLNKTATNCYFQNLTLKSAMGDSRGRDIVLNDKSDRTIFKDACLWAYQDTYVSNNQNGKFYFEGGVLRGTTDFLCGKGDVFYQGVKLQHADTKGYICAPSQARKHGYVFNECEIVGEKKGTDGNFTLGRPWGSGTPSALFINTKMTCKPSAAGWGEMSGGWPARFAEYNSTTSEGTVIDLKDRKKTFGDGHTNNPVLTKAEAEALTLANVMGDGDDWDPTLATEQAPEPTNVVTDGSVITWDNSDYTSLWAVCMNGKVIAFTTNPYHIFNTAIDTATASAYSVRAANEMGGLGAAVTAKVGTPSSITSAVAEREIVATACYNLQGIRVAPDTKGILIKVITYSDGTTSTVKTMVR
ncbi:MAG: pectinesterase family protein [Muribaculaceae bacterium]|nr:pectinesterase family protein [Muribaculaceae bacterium]